VLNALQQMTRLLLSLSFLSILAAGTWYGYRFLHRQDFELEEMTRELDLKRAEADRQKAVIERQSMDLLRQGEEIDDLRRMVAELEENVARLDTALRFLKVDHRQAHVLVLDQKATDDGKLHTQFRFVEVDDQGQPIQAPIEGAIEGDLLYIDAWVIKFEDALVEAGDALRSTSICLFKRAFGEFQSPSEGISLDPSRARPPAYGGGEMSELETQLWNRFWDITDDPSMAKKYGVRAAHGEAPSQRLRRGFLYKLELRASGGLSFTPEKLPAGLDH